MPRRAWLIGVFILIAVALMGLWFVPPDRCYLWLWSVFGVVSLQALFQFSKGAWETYQKWREKRRPLVFHAHNCSFTFMGTDAGGGESATTRQQARYITYWFELNVFNPRPENVGLLDWRLRFEKNGGLIQEQVPTQHTGEVRIGAIYCPDVVTLTLQSKVWGQIVFQGGAGLDVADCNAIYLTARSVTGELCKVRLADGIREHK